MSSSVPAQAQLNVISFNSKLEQFRVWKLKVESYLDSLGLENEITSVKTESNERNKKVKAFLILSIDTETLSLLSKVKESTAHEVWKQMCEHHERDSTASRLQLKTLLLTDKLRSNEKVNDFISRIIKVSEQLKMIGKAADDEDLLLCLLRGISFNPDYAMISTILKNQDGMTFAKACHRVQDNEVERSMLFESKCDSVNYVHKTPKHKFNEKNQLKGNYCNYCKKKGHKYEDCDRRLKRCHKCHKPGHYAKDCKYSNIDQNNINTSNSNISNQSSDRNSFVGSVSNNDGLQKNNWIIDSGCSSHYCNDINLLSNIRDEESFVTCANQETIKISKVGEVHMSNNNTDITLKNVKYNPNFTNNLLSIPKLVENGAIASFEGDQTTIKSNGVVVMKGIKKDGLYYLQCETKDQNDRVLGVNEKLSEIELIHNRLGHIGNTGMKQLLNKQAANGIETVNIDEMKNCETCSIGKAHRIAFGDYSSREKAQAPLERIHCDLSSFIHQNNYKYVSVIVDEYSRKASVKILNHKHETADHIKDWINVNENKLNMKVKEFHSDGGGEYTSSVLKNYLIEKGIKCTITCKGTPQHNGIAERYNQTLFNTARCLLQHARLSLEFTECAIRTAAYLLQFRLSVTDKNKTVYELFYGSKPSIKHLKVFGCDSFVHTNDNSKLEARAMRGIFVGYSEYKVNGYEVLLLDTGKIITSRDVTLEENKFTFGVRLEESRMNELLQLDCNSVNTNSNISIPIASYSESDLSSNNYYNNLQLDNESNDNNIQQIANEATINIEQQFRERPRRIRRQPLRYGHVDMNDVYDEDRNDVNMNVNDTSIQDPLTVEEALNSAKADKWRNAMDIEMKQLRNNETWSLCELPDNRKAISNKWVFKTKLHNDGTIEREKARLCAKGFSQVQYTDFNETFAPVMKYKSLRTLLAIATIKNYEIEHLDVQTAFLNATLKEDIYMKQPEYYEIHSKDGKELVCKLKKSIYGLKQASNEWNKEVSNTIQSFGFNQCKSDTCVYVKRSIKNNVVILAIFVDDIIVIHSPQDNDEWCELKMNFMKKYKIKDNRSANFILGMKIERGINSLKISQELQVNKVLKQFDMINCKSRDTPSEIAKLTQVDCPTTEVEIMKMKQLPYESLVGNVLYLSICTRPDISYSVNRVSRFMKNPGKDHWIACKRILRYLKSTPQLGLQYQNDQNDNVIELIGYCDADWAGDIDDRKSTTGFVIKINNCVVHWGSKKQDTVSLSSAEAEYMSICSTVTELKWFTSLLKELQVLTNPTPILYCDNQSAIAISENDKFHNRTKHIDIRHHYIRDMIKSNQVSLEWIESGKQQADILTKGLNTRVFNQLRKDIMKN